MIFGQLKCLALPINLSSIVHVEICILWKNNEANLVAVIYHNQPSNLPLAATYSKVSRAATIARMISM